MTTRETISKAISTWMMEHLEKPTVHQIGEYMDRARSLELVVEKLVSDAQTSPPTFVRGLTLGELIDRLASVSPKAKIKFDFGYLQPEGLHSYRGYYEDLAIGYNDIYERRGPMPPQVLAKTFREELLSAVGTTYTGWKGGEYTMRRESRVWVDNAGVCNGVAIVDVESDEYTVLLRTWAIDR